MKFIKVDLPVWLGFAGGMVVLFASFLVAQSVQSAATWLLEWTVVLAAFAMALGYGNMLRVHANRVRFKRAAWHYSYVTIAVMIGYFLLGITTTPRGEAYAFIFDNVYGALSATVFSLNAFHMCTAVYRAFSIRNAHAATLLVTGVIVMLGKVGVGTAISPNFALATDWIMTVANSAGMRAINMCAALGMIGVSVRVILGLERGHLGGGG